MLIYVIIIDVLWFNFKISQKKSIKDINKKIPKNKFRDFLIHCAEY